MSLHKLGRSLLAIVGIAAPIGGATHAENLDQDKSAARLFVHVISASPRSADISYDAMNG